MILMSKKPADDSIEDILVHAPVKRRNVSSVCTEPAEIQPTNKIRKKKVVSPNREL